MHTTLTAVLPIFLLLVLGQVSRRSGFLNKAFWAQAEKGTYYILLPALLIGRLAEANLDWDAQLWLVLATLLIPICSAIICFALQWVLRLASRDFTSFFQGGIRFNTYIGLALVAFLPGDGLTLAALIMAVMIPIVNILCVLMYEIFNDTKGVNWHQTLTGIAQNPLVLSCAIGSIINVSGVPIPDILQTVLDKLGMMALPMGLLAVGAGLRLQALRGSGWVFAWSALSKLILLPLAAFGITHILSIDGLAQAVLVIYTALPTAASSYILARQMQGNAELMAGIITGQTVLSMLSLPLVLLLLQNF